MPSRKRTPSRPSKAADQETYYEFEMRNRGASSPDSTGPPTPPRKDTPKDVKGKEQRDGQPAQEHAELEDSAAKIPNFLTSTKPISSEGGKSPTKFCPLTAADYAKLIEQPYVASARADMSDAGAIELEGDSRHALFKSDDTEQRQRYPGWWNEEREKLFTTVKDNILPPTFYSPSQFSARLFEGRPSHNVSFQVPRSPLLTSAACPATVKCAFLRLSSNRTRTSPHLAFAHRLHSSFTAASCASFSSY
jgi:hypothetical protein